MRNPWFHFKQFSLRQDKAAMKICTDSCVFGAWVAERIGPSARILDIGTGTGLLTLMLAQKKQTEACSILEAIELDQLSKDEAADNFAGSPWNEKIVLHSGDVRQTSFANRFDFVIVNPPFYESQLKSPEVAVNKARHETGLSLNELIVVLKRVLAAGGQFAILLPSARAEYFCDLAGKAGYSLSDQCRLKQTPDHPPFRSMMLFAPLLESALSEGNYRPGVTELALRDNAGRETPELLEIMRDYYIR